MKNSLLLKAFENCTSHSHSLLPTALLACTPLKYANYIFNFLDVKCKFLNFIQTEKHLLVVKFSGSS